MSAELNLRFPDHCHVIVRLGDVESAKLPFKNPFNPKEHQEIQWYIEMYGAHSLADPDDTEAKRIAGQLPVFGKGLFDAVFSDRESQRLLNTFQDTDGDTRLVTISAEHPSVLALPWELLHDSASGGNYLFLETRRISIRRRVSGATGGRAPYRPAAKDALHLLFVVSRPSGSGFIDPRADSLPVLDAIEQHAPGRVTWEFLRPSTLDALLERLEDTAKPPVDILHFDGHGVFDRHGGLPERAVKRETARQSFEEVVIKDQAAPAPAAVSAPNTGYLLFETPEGKIDFVSADKLGANLHRHKVALVILSACQSAAMEQDRADGDGHAEAPMGSVAARLTATGIPSVLAMTHSVLVHTTRTLFGEFYKELARHKGIGEALDNARRHLFNHPEKYEVQRYDSERGAYRKKLELHDWFLPALYQQGADGPLLLPPSSRGHQSAHIGGEGDQRRLTSATTTRTNLPPAPEAGFFGRRQDLWEIERWFAGPTRRITITGFGGQGKTALAQEAGRWLTRTGLFRAAAFVDYSRVQAVDSVSVAVSNIGSVLGESLIDADAATAVLAKTPTLVILDNLEALAPDSLRALLDAAVAWSGAGGSRVLCTTRRPEFGHAAYKIEGTHIHRRIQLDGLGSKQSPEDALEWFANLDRFPPAPNWPRPQAEDWRTALVNLFDRVKFHPLSIRVLAQQLKTRRPAELGGRLEELLGSAGKTGSATVSVALTGVPAGQPRAEVSGEDAGHSGRDARAPQDEDTPAGLLASLELSLDQLDEAARQVLPRLGVFQGGAMEEDLLIITGLGESGQREQIEGFLAAVEAGKAEEVFKAMGQPLPDDSQLQELIAGLRERLAQLPPPAANLWPGLRRQLEAAALIEAEDIPGVSVPFLRFHPTLAPMLWAQLDADERARLGAAHRQRYYQLSGYLYREDTRNPHQARAIAWRELPNLLHAVHAALDVGEPDAVDFADNVNRFLGDFGLKQEAERLTAKAQAAAGEVGSQAWFLAQSNRGEQLFAAGQVAEAAQAFQDVLKQLGDKPTYERAVTLGRLGRCFRAGGRPDLAAQSASEAIAVCDKLEQNDQVKRERGTELTDLADALRYQGKYAEARKAYQDALKIVEDLKDLRSQGVALGQLGTLAMTEGNLKEAAERHRAALALFQQLREPAMEAVAWHQLGMVFQEARQWDEAERHYRESARIEEERGNLAGAADTWNQLANVSVLAGKPNAAEPWYRKAVEADRILKNAKNLASDFSNLANVLQTQPGRLAEARQLAEEALVIKKTLDPGAAQIWTTYNILAQIAEQEEFGVPPSGGGAGVPPAKAGTPSKAREYRRLAREAKRNFAGTRHELRRRAPLILGTVVAVADAKQRQDLEKALPSLEKHGWTSLVAAIRRILGGERDADALCANLDFEDSMIIETILAGLADPSTLSDLLPPQ